MLQRTVGIGEMCISNRLNEVIVTYSLGSCVGLALYDRELRLAGLIHCMLPLSSMNAAKASDTPELFVDTGVAALLQAMYDAGSEPRRLIARVAGAASPMDENGTFRIGERNMVVLRKMLQNNRIRLVAEEIGGTEARTMYFHVADGRIVLKSRGRESEL